MSKLIEGCFEGYNATVLAYGQVSHPCRTQGLFQAQSPPPKGGARPTRQQSAEAQLCSFVWHLSYDCMAG